VAGLVTSLVRQLKESLTEARGEGEAVQRGGANAAGAAAAAAASMQSAQGLQVVLAMLDAYSSMPAAAESEEGANRYAVYLLY
jgi:hypothetical protein